MGGLSVLLALLCVAAFFALVIVVLNPERWNPSFPEELPPSSPRVRPPPRATRRPFTSHLGVVLVSLGAIVLMVAERPELRARPGRTLAVFGQGSAAVGAAILGTRVLANARRRGSRSGQEVADRPAEEDPDAVAGGPVPLTIALAVAPGSDIDRVRELLRSSLEHAQVMAAPSPEVCVSDEAGARIACSVKVWIGDRDARERVTSDLNFKIYRALRAGQIDLVPTRGGPESMRA